MGLVKTILNIDTLDETIERILQAARIPGAAIAIVVGDECVYAKGYGYRDVEAQLPATPDTIYPIASTTKAFNATLLGMLVDEDRLAWDMPVQRYLPSFRLGDHHVSAQVTTRDLIAMRTGLPRHDWLWLENLIPRASLVERLRHLGLAAGFRERFQYNNLTVTAAGHIAEVVTGQCWEDLVQERLLTSLGMSSTCFAPPEAGDATLSYHESSRRELIATRRLATTVAAPSGGAMHSTVKDMALWMSVNLSGGGKHGRQVISSPTLAEVHSPQMIVGSDPSAPSPGAAYAMGWFADTYNGRKRLTHGGYLHDVDSEVTLFPLDGIGIVSFTNFGCPTMGRFINQHAFDLVMGLAPVETLEAKLAEYERKIAETRRRHTAVRRAENTTPSHTLDAYTGSYRHPGYGAFAIRLHGEGLCLERHALMLPLEHWHYDAWVVAENDLFVIHRPHAFDRASHILFETDADGEIGAFTIELEPSVPPVRLVRQREASP